MANNQARGSDSVDKTRAELGTMIPEGPTSIRDEYVSGGKKNSPGQSRSMYDGGQAGADGEENIAAGAGK